MSKHSFVCGGKKIEYQIVRKKRATIQLKVTPELKVIVTCPAKLSQTAIENFLLQKSLWVHKQLLFFKKYQKKEYTKEYVSGESFYYLGRQYQLIITKAKEDRVVLSVGKLQVYSTLGAAHRAHTKHLVSIWYRERANEVFRELFVDELIRFKYSKTLLLRISPMSRKWGSFNGCTITLNPLLIQASKSAIRYVLAHELCHVKYKKHDKNFWKLLDHKYPGWEKEKEKLEVRFG